MKITIVTVGKIKEKYLRDAIEEYTKRLSKYCKLEIIQVADEKTPENASQTVEDQIRQKEADQNQRADRNEIKLDSRGQNPCRPPADHGMRGLHPRPAQTEIQAGKNHPLRTQRHIYRHL